MAAAGFEPATKGGIHLFFVSSERILSWSPLYAYPAEFGKLFDSSPSAMSPVAAFLHAAEWYLRLIMNGGVVDMYHT